MRTNMHKRLHLRMASLLAIVLMVLSRPLFAAPWILERADSPEQITEEHVSELEKRALAGDWNLKLEFAAAWLYETKYPQIYGCKRLEYGFRCRAMAKREASGKAFLREIIDTTPTDELTRIDIRSFQANYALRVPIRGAAPDSTECIEAVRYFKLAVQNGKNCAARHLAAMAEFGMCLPKDMDAFTKYTKMTSGCPMP